MERTLRAGRGANDVKIMPASEFILAATPQEALEKKEWVRSLQIGPQQAIAYLEQFWGRELQGYDPDGPLPEIDPVVEETSETRGSGFHGAKARQLADQWRAEAKEKGLSIRQFVSAKTSRGDSTFTGSYTEVADRLAEYARDRRRRRLQHLAVADPDRPGRHRQPPRPGTAGARRVPHRVRGQHAAGEPRPGHPGRQDASVAWSVENVRSTEPDVTGHGTGLGHPRTGSELAVGTASGRAHSATHHPAAADGLGAVPLDPGCTIDCSVNRRFRSQKGSYGAIDRTVTITGHFPVDYGRSCR